MDDLHNMQPQSPEGALTLADFTYELPEELVAQEPQARRDASRLLVRRAMGSLEHGVVENLADFLPKDALLFVNDSQVFASRLFAKLPSGGKAELFLLSKPQGEISAQVGALGRPMRKFKLGTVLALPGGVSATVSSEQPLQLTFNRGAKELMPYLAAAAYIPLPPYIRRPSPLPAAESPDGERYQTIFARELGSVAAPTAGLHFTPELFARLKAKGIERHAVTLHVGAGTFLPVKCQNLGEHAMHEEEFLVSPEAVQALIAAKKSGRKIVAVGTTTLRCLESLYRLAEGQEERLLDFAGTWQRTKLFIYPKQRGERYRPFSADYLLSNFHQPGSTLLMLIAALIGLDETLAMYRSAIEQRYRFFSYGDACLFDLGAP